MFDMHSFAFFILFKPKRSLWSDIDWFLLIITFQWQHTRGVLQPLRWRCIDCVIHHEWDVCKKQLYVRGTSKQW